MTLTRACKIILNIKYVITHHLRKKNFANNLLQNKLAQNVCAKIFSNRSKVKSRCNAFCMAQYFFYLNEKEKNNKNHVIKKYFLRILINMHISVVEQ